MAAEAGTEVETEAGTEAPHASTVDAHADQDNERHHAGPDSAAGGKGGVDSE